MSAPGGARPPARAEGPPADEASVRAFKRGAWTEPDFVRGYVRRTSGRKGVARVKNALERRFLRRHAAGRVLDAGCGAGRHLAPLAAAGLTVHGSDISAAMLAQAGAALAEAGAAVRVAQADIERLPFRDGCFDTVCSITVVEHFPQWRAIVAEYGRVLRTGGTLLFELPNAEQAPTASGAALDPTSYVSRARADELPGLLSPLGLEVVELLPYDFWNGNEALARRWSLDLDGRRRVLRWADRLLALPGAAALWLALEPRLLARLGTAWAPNLLVRAVKRG